MSEITDRSAGDTQKPLERLVTTHPDLLRFAFILGCVSIFWLFGYGQGCFNPLYSHDGLIIDSASDVNWEIGQGRFIQIIYWLLRGTIAAPTLVNGLAVFWLSVCCFMVAKLLDIKSPVFIVLLTGILTLNPANTYTNATYICWIDTYQLALALAVGTLFSLRKIANTAFKLLLSITLLTLSLGLYQNYIAVFVFLALALFIKDILGMQSLKTSLKTLVLCICSLVLALIAYYFTWKIVLFFNPQISITSYNGFDLLGNYDGVSFISLLCETYTAPFAYLARPETFHRTISGALDIFILAISVVLLIFKLTKMKEPSRIIAIAVATLLLPIGANCIYIISKGTFHSLMVAPYYFSFVVSLALLESTIPLIKRNMDAAIKLVLCMAMAAIVFFNGVYASDALLKKQFIYQSTDAAVTRIVDRMEETEGYEAGKTPVAFIGQLRYSSLFTNRTHAFDEIVGVGFYNSSITRTSSTDQWLKTIYGYNYLPASSGERDELSKSETVQQMGAFPAADAIQMIDGTLVVKLSSRI